MRILVTGKRSFAAEGFAERLRSTGHDVVEASCGEVLPHGRFDAVVNFALRRNAPVRTVEEDMRNLVEWCVCAGVEHFVQVSSLAVYPPEAGEIDEGTEIDGIEKGDEGYRAMKIAQDRYLLGMASAPFALSFVRPGVLVDEEGNFRSGGIGAGVWKCGIVLGGAQTPLAVCERERFHAKLEEVLAAGESCVAIVGRNSTKKRFLEKTLGGVWMPLPEKAVKAIARVFMTKRAARRVAGLFARPLLKGESA